MSHNYTIIGWNESNECYILQDEDGEECLFDLIDIDVIFDYEKGATQPNKDMFGRKIFIKTIKPYICAGYEIEFKN